MKNIGLGFGFSPTLEALVEEVFVMAESFGAKATFIHAGTPTEKQQSELEYYIRKCGFADGSYQVIYREGPPLHILSETVRNDKVDLLVTGALRREKSVKHYFGSLARNLARHFKMPLMLIPEAKLPLKPIENIIISVSEDESESAVETGLLFARHYKDAHIWLVKESALAGFSHGISQYYSENKYSEGQEKLIRTETSYIDMRLRPFDTAGLKLSKKVIFGHSGIGLAAFAKHINADLIIDSYPDFSLGILDRLFPHDIEYTLRDLPCKLILVNN